MHITATLQITALIWDNAECPFEHFAKSSHFVASVIQKYDNETEAGFLKHFALQIKKWAEHDITHWAGGPMGW